MTRCGLSAVGAGHSDRETVLRAVHARRWRPGPGGLLIAGLLAACSAGNADLRPVSAPDSTATLSSPTPSASAPVEVAGVAPQPVTLAFGGDVHFEGAVRARLTRDPGSTFGTVAEVLRRADLAVVNLETAVTERGTPAPKKYTFRAPTTAFDALRAAGVDVVSMANNHGMDFGLVGLRDSLAAAAAQRFPVVGIGRDDDEAFRPYIATVKGSRIAVLGATQVLDDFAKTAWRAAPGKPGLASAYDEERLVRAVTEARAAADTVVVFLHWGQEQNRCPIERQQQLAGRLAEAGADVLVGSHAHVLLGGGYLDSSDGTKAYVHYGLGNFVWYSRGGPGSVSGVLTLTVRGREVSKPRWLSATISGGATTPLEGTAAGRAVTSWDRLRACTGLQPG